MMERGFTLAELLMVIAILGVLAAVVIPSVGGMYGKGTREAFETDRHTIQGAVFSYYSDVHDRPGPETGAGHWFPTHDGKAGVIDFALLTQRTDGRGPYLAEIPRSSVAKGGIYRWAIDSHGRVVTIFNDSGSPNLVLNLTFNEGLGTTANDSSADAGHDNDATLYGAQWSSGKVGAALAFDGVDDYVRNSSPEGLDFSSTNEMSIEAWFMLTGHSGYDGVVSLNDGSCAYRLMVDPDLHPFYDPGAHHDQVVGSYTFALNAWYHYVMTVKGGGNAVIYVNGEPISTSPSGVPATLPDGSDILIGAGEAPGVHHLCGIIDEVRVYNRALSAVEVKARYEATK